MNRKNHSYTIHSLVFNREELYMHEAMLQQLQHLMVQHDELEKHLATSIHNPKAHQTLFSQYAKQKALLEKFYQWKKLKQQLKETVALLDDPEMEELASEEAGRLEKELKKIEFSIENFLLPQEQEEQNACFLEIRAGTGGEEAAFFCVDLLRMYLQYALSQKYNVQIHQRSESETGGLKSVTLKITGQEAYSKFRHESGGHRVQRVPATESQGRVHTSNCIVMVIPEAPQKKSIEVNPADLRVDTFRASGAGGQHVNKTDSAVRITHIPTGIVAACQTERSQHQNRESAMEMLRARLNALEEEKRQNEETELRLSLLSSGRRTDRIRTYNFPQGRITDHRLNLTLFCLDSVLSGALDPLLKPILNEYQKQRMAHAQEKRALFFAQSKKNELSN